MHLVRALEWSSENPWEQFSQTEAIDIEIHFLLFLKISCLQIFYNYSNGLVQDRSDRSESAPLYFTIRFQIERFDEVKFGFSPRIHSEFHSKIYTATLCLSSQQQFYNVHSGVQAFSLTNLIIQNNNSWKSHTIPSAEMKNKKKHTTCIAFHWYMFCFLVTSHMRIGFHLILPKLEKIY